MNKLLPLLFVVQKLLLVSSYWFFRVRLPKSERDSVDWIVGPVEVASMVHQISGAVSNSESVSLSTHALYQRHYDHDLAAAALKTRRFGFLRASMRRAVLLGKLMNRARGFLYVAQFGFLFDRFDSREFEFRFLKSKSRKVGVYWCGSEIRSPKVMSELEKSLQLPNVFTYITHLAPHFADPAHERLLERRARVGMTYADVMFDAPTDQAGYLTGHREPFFFFMAPEQFVNSTEKFNDLSHLVVTHATTSPVIKGTQLVRAAVAKLKAEGYKFEYVELMGVDNSIVAKQLERTHIALNQFFGFTTAVFGMEALAARCAVLSSADGTVETSLAPGANDATLVTKHWQVYDHLRQLLDHPEQIEPLAVAGQAWAHRYASRENAGALVTAILNSVLDGSYSKEARSALTNAEAYGNFTASDAKVAGE